MQRKYWKLHLRIHNLQFRLEQDASKRQDFKWLYLIIRNLRLEQWHVHSSLQEEIFPSEVVMFRENRECSINPDSSSENELGVWARTEIKDPLLGEECLIRFQEPIAIDPDSFALIRNRRVLLTHSSFLGTSAQFKCFAHLSYSRFRMAHLEARQIPRAVFFHYNWGYNYFHFHMDVFSMLRILDEYPQFHSYPFVVNRMVWERPFFHSILNRAGLANVRWIVPADHECLEVGELIVARGNAMSRVGVRHLKEALRLKGDVKVNRKVYIRRGPGTTRSLQNQSEICALLKTRNFEIVDTAQMTYEEQVKLFSECRWLVAEHGAGLTNMIYRKGAPLSVLELFPPNSTTHACYYRLAMEIDATHSSLAGVLHPEEGLYRIPVEQLEEAISSMFGGA